MLGERGLFSTESSQQMQKREVEGAWCVWRPMYEWFRVTEMQSLCVTAGGEVDIYTGVRIGKVLNILSSFYETDIENLICTVFP